MEREKFSTTQNQHFCIISSQTHVMLLQLLQERHDAQASMKAKETVSNL